MLFEGLTEPSEVGYGLRPDYPSAIRLAQWNPVALDNGIGRTNYSQFCMRRFSRYGSLKKNFYRLAPSFPMDTMIQRESFNAVFEVSTNNRSVPGNSPS